MSTILKIGDIVMWRGAWGESIPKMVKVKRITLVENSVLDGTEVNAVPWIVLKDRTVVLDLDNDHWCYGMQVSPLPFKT